MMTTEAPQRAFKKLMLGKTANFLKEVRMEVRKINWPGRDQTVRYTMVVLGVSVIVAVFLGALDYLFNLILEKFIL